jgi:hypothetical protein
MVINRIIHFYLVYCVLLSVIGYLGDCLLNFDYAIENPNYLPWYFISHLVFQCYIILPAILSYAILSTKMTNYLALKIIYMLMVSWCIALFLYPDDYSLTIGRHKKVKQMSVYMLSGLILVGWSERRREKIVTNSYLL